MKITFLLFAKVHKPIGGVKVVYEYANRLSRRGHEVTVVHAVLPDPQQPWYVKIAKVLLFTARRLAGLHTSRNWFAVDPAVRLRWCVLPRVANIPDGDVVVATAWTTAWWLQDAPPGKGIRAYLLQHLETWSGDPARVIDSWKLPLRKVAIARWLVAYGEDMGEAVDYVPNGLDFSGWDQDVPPAERDPASVTLLCHWRPYKGTRDAIAALEQVRAGGTALRVNMFGVIPRPDWVPDWFEYHQDPPQSTLRRLYNAGAIFIAPSHEEGWGLPACEAMACGCALVASDVGGHREFASDGDTALLFPARDIDALARRVQELVADPQARIALAQRGYRSVRRFEWDRSVDALEQLFRQWVRSA